MNDKAIYREHKLKDGHILQIFQDTWAESPRSWDNLGTMAIFHKRYNFGDEVEFASADFENWSEMEEYIKLNLHAAAYLPIYMYDHSGITINTQGFSSPWDSGQVGFIYVTEEKLKQTYCETNLTEEHLERAKISLEGEVKIMDKYITGDVYGFQLIKKTDGEDEIIDSCSGFYGEDVTKNGMLDHIFNELIPEELITKL
jgi:hypothetical protein